jgi:hypothetical protein
MADCWRFRRWVYRIIPSDAHQPLWVVTLAALAGGLGVVFAVLAARQDFG